MGVGLPGGFNTPISRLVLPGSTMQCRSRSSGRHRMARFALSSPRWVHPEHASAPRRRYWPLVRLLFCWYARGVEAGAKEAAFPGGAERAEDGQATAQLSTWRCTKVVGLYVIAVALSTLSPLIVGFILGVAGIDRRSQGPVAVGLVWFGSVLCLAAAAPYLLYLISTPFRCKALTARLGHTALDAVHFMNCFAESIAAVGVFFITLFLMRPPHALKLHDYAGAKDFFIAVTGIIPVFLIAWIIERRGEGEYGTASSFGLRPTDGNERWVRRYFATTAMVQYAMLAVGASAGLSGLLKEGEVPGLIRICSACLLGAGVGLGFRIVRKTMGPIRDWQWGRTG